MKIAKSCMKGMAANQRRSGSEGHRFKTQQGHFAEESPLKCTLHLVFWIHNINSCVRCIGWLYICFSCDRCAMSSINKRSTRALATFWKKGKRRREKEDMLSRRHSNRGHEERTLHFSKVQICVNVFASRCWRRKRKAWVEPILRKLFNIERIFDANYFCFCFQTILPIPIPTGSFRVLAREAQIIGSLHISVEAMSIFMVFEQPGDKALFV